MASWIVRKRWRQRHAAVQTRNDALRETTAANGRRSGCPAQFRCKFSAIQRILRLLRTLMRHMHAPMFGFAFGFRAARDCRLLADPQPGAIRYFSATGISASCDARRQACRGAQAMPAGHGAGKRAGPA
jgi:hypothetical protein